jgi:site-specific recombinase XerD
VPLFVTVRSRTSPHRFRHTYATRLLEHGVDVRVVKELLGHEDIKSTVTYTEVTDAALN